MELLKLVIVDDEAIILRGLLETYDWEGMGFKVVGSAESGEKAKELIRALKPDVVLTDIRMKQITGLMLMEQVKDFDEDVLFIVVSAYRDFEYAQKACEIGAFSYLLKPIEEEKLKSTMKAAFSHCIEEQKRKYEHKGWQKILLDGGDNFLQVLIGKYLSGTISGEKIQDVLTLLDRRIREEDRLIAVCADIDVSYQIMNPLGYEAERFSLFQYLEQVLKETYEVWTFELEKNGRIFLLHTNRCPGPVQVKKIMEQTRHKKSSNLISSISREYKGFTAISKSFTEAVRLFEVASASGAGAFTISGKAGEEEDGRHYSADAEAAVIHAVRKNDIGQLKEALIEFIFLLPSDEQVQCAYFHRLMIQAQFSVRESYGYTEEADILFRHFYSNLDQLSASRLVDICYTLLGKVVEIRKVTLESQEAEYFSDYMYTAVAYINDNLGDESLSIVSVATQIYLNPVYFGRVFKHIHQMTFKQYVLRKRMEMAKKLIAEGRETITVICEKVGIPNTSYFSQVFKQYTGKLPSEYKKEFEE